MEYLPKFHEEEKVLYSLISKIENVENKNYIDLRGIGSTENGIKGSHSLGGLP